uniref:Phosphatidylethanolamine-binding protein n=1 Tax=Clastoptera arizonana TaxID=38151 RepID=A0A1B6C3A5_9HEMI
MYWSFSLVLLLRCLVTQGIKYKVRVDETTGYTKENGCFGYGLAVKTHTNLTIDEVNCHAICHPDDFQHKPKIFYYHAVDNYLYIVVMVNANPYYYEEEYYLHWLVANIKGQDLRVGNFSKADRLIPYKAPFSKEKNPESIRHQVFIMYQEYLIPNDKIKEKKRHKFKFFDWLSYQTTTETMGPMVGVEFTINFPGKNKLN